MRYEKTILATIVEAVERKKKTENLKGHNLHKLFGGMKKNNGKILY